MGKPLTVVFLWFILSTSFAGDSLPQSPMNFCASKRVFTQTSKTGSSERRMSKAGDVVKCVDFSTELLKTNIMIRYNGGKAI